MPIVTDAGDEAVVTAWFVGDGDAVEQGQLIAEVQAEKVAQDVEAPVAGTVGECVAINQPVAQGDPICAIAPGAAPAVPEGDLVVEVTEAPQERRPSSPAARRVARDRGVDLSTVTGTGPGGRITEQDVLSATPESAVSPPTDLRAVIARKLRRSAEETASVTLTTTAAIAVDASDHLTARVVRAASGALGGHPALDGTRDGDRFVPTDDTRICVAIQTDEGLVAPALRDIAGATPAEIDERIEVLAARARAGVLEAADYAGGTFTVTNLGSWGVEWFTPIINLPQVAILGVGALRTVPAFDGEGLLVPRRELPLSLTFDHAFVDGAPAAAFLADVVAELGRTPD